MKNISKNQRKIDQKWVENRGKSISGHLWPSWRLQGGVLADLGGVPGNEGGGSADKRGAVEGHFCQI